MKLKTSFILCSIIAMMSSPVCAANAVWDLYAGASIGVGAETIFADDDNDTKATQSFGAMFGIDLPAFRVEVEYNRLSNSDNYTNLAIANLYFKMPATVIKPYVGLGAGIMFGGENEKYDVDLKTTGAYQGMVGVTLGVPSLPFKFDIEGRVLYLPDVAKFAGIEPDILHYDARVKIRYLF